MAGATRGTARGGGGVGAAECHRGCGARLAGGAERGRVRSASSFAAPGHAPPRAGGLPPARKYSAPHGAGRAVLPAAPPADRVVDTGFW